LGGKILTDGAGTENVVLFFPKGDCGWENKAGPLRARKGARRPAQQAGPKKKWPANVEKKTNPVFFQISHQAPNPPNRVGAGGAGTFPPVDSQAQTAGFVFFFCCLKRGLFWLFLKGPGLCAPGFWGGGKTWGAKEKHQLFFSAHGEGQGGAKKNPFPGHGPPGGFISGGRPFGKKQNFGRRQKGQNNRAPRFQARQ